MFTFNIKKCLHKLYGYTKTPTVVCGFLFSYKRCNLAFIKESAFAANSFLSIEIGFLSLFLLLVKIEI